MTNKHRLPSHIVPERYQIMLKPHLDSFVFAGEEIILETAAHLVDYVIPRVPVRRCGRDGPHGPPPA